MVKGRISKVAPMAGVPRLTRDQLDAVLAARTLTISGDASGSGVTSITLTLATVNANVGSFGSSTSIPSFTVNGKGLITAASGNVVIAPAGTLTGTTLAAGVVTSSLTTIGTLVAGAVPASLVTAGTFGTGAYVFDNGAGSDGFIVYATGGRQFRTGYNASNYMTIGVTSAGNVLYDATGASAGHTFADAVVGQAGLYSDTVIETPTAYIATRGSVGTINSTSTFFVFGAGTTGVSSFRVTHGVAPTAPVNGDVWGVSGESLYYRNNGVTQYASWTKQAAIADVSAVAGGVVIDEEVRTGFEDLRTKFNSLLTKLETINIITT